MAGGTQGSTHLRRLNVTAFIACQESAASDQLRQRLFTANGTQITDVISGRPARGVMGRWQQEIDHPLRPAHAD